MESIDEHLLRSLVQGHSKTALEFLYLETGAIPIRHIISGRRILYLQTILKRSENEITRRVLLAQVADPCPGDFVKLVDTDIKKVDLNIEYEEIESMNAELFKQVVKKKIKEAAFKHLKELQTTHSKIRDIEYEEYACQPYILSSIFTNEDVNLLHALRGRSVECKVNFRGRYGDDLSCPLCETGAQDDQPHILICPKIVEKLSTSEIVRNKVKYEHIFGEPQEQKVVTVLFSKMIDIRKKLIETQNQLED